jgi:hypothetical protein
MIPQDPQGPSAVPSISAVMLLLLYRLLLPSLAGAVLFVPFAGTEPSRGPRPVLLLSLPWHAVLEAGMISSMTFDQLSRVATLWQLTVCSIQKEWKPCNLVLGTGCLACGAIAQGAYAVWLTSQAGAWLLAMSQSWHERSVQRHAAHKRATCAWPVRGKATSTACGS